MISLMEVLCVKPEGATRAGLVEVIPDSRSNAVDALPSVMRVVGPSCECPDKRHVCTRVLVLTRSKASSGPLVDHR